MFLTEYNEKLHERTCREEGWEEGRMEGITQGRVEGITGSIRILRKIGQSDAEIREALKDAYSLTDSEIEGYMR